MTWTIEMAWFWLRFSFLASANKVITLCVVQVRYAVILTLMAAGIAGCTHARMEMTSVGRAAQESRSDSPDDILGDAVFSLVKGMASEDAIERLIADGASCVERSCAWTFIERETFWEHLGVRQPGPLRAWRRIYRVDLASSFITKRSDIIATVTSTKIKS